tara:strand:- start:56 stop:520 length:465 start_codon:yes stop_codon:yes gene_type:complete
MVAISTVAAVVTIAGTAYSVSEQRKGKKANREIARRQQRQQALKAARSRRIAFRELQIKRAQAQASQAALGLSGSSGAAGGLASLTSQYGANLGYGSAMTNLSREITGFSSIAQSAFANAQTGAAVSGLGLSIAQNPKPFQDAFDKVTGKRPAQ